MVFVATEEITRVQQNTSHVRNMCIIAHVDHGKTTLSDFLISSNGIISESLAGQIRYMDSRPDEQEKLITMKSSSISLLYNHPEEKDSPYIVNLIDSPGHVDFSCEVSTAARLTDGALVIVDALEGVCTQTRTVLQQAYKENIEPCLVLNKIDRLITAQKMTPLECYRQLRRILEQVNVLMTTFTTADLFKKQAISNANNQKQVSKPETANDQQQSATTASATVLEADIDSEQFFSPQKGNVVFTSAADAWGFRINDFADIFHKKMGMKKEILQKTLWGEFYLDKKTKKIRTKPKKQDEEPMFVQFILSNIYNIYDAVVLNPDADKIKKIITSLELQVHANLFKKQDKRTHIRAILGRWLPLSDSILRMVVENLPNPQVAQRNRILHLVPELEDIKTGIKKDKSITEVDSDVRIKMRNFRRKLKKNMLRCDSSEKAEVMVFVSKMLEVDTLPSAVLSSSKQLSKIRQPNPSNADNDMISNSTENTIADVNTLEDFPLDEEEGDGDSKQHFVGFARIYSGTIRVGQKLQILGPQYNAFDRISIDMNSW
jgi:ribosome assembly protein 1